VGKARRKSLLELRLEGPGVRSGTISVPDLVNVCEHAQSAVNRQAEAMEGQRSLRPGPITTAVRRECTLEFIGLRKGSVMLRFGLAKPQLPLPETTTFGPQVVKTIACAISSLSKRSKTIWEDSLDAGVLDSLRNMGEVFERKSITKIEWLVPARNGRRRIRAVYTKAVRERVIERIKLPGRAIRNVEGILEMADFKETDQKCRIHPTIGYPVTCTFDKDKEEAVYAVLRKPVRVTGEATLDPQTDRIESIHIRELTPLEPLMLGTSVFFAAKSLAELANLQGVKPLESVSALAGGWPEEEDLDELLDEIYRDREIA